MFGPRFLVVAQVLALPWMTKAGREPPRIHERKVVPRQYYKEGASLNLTCKATGDPSPRYIWLHNGKPLEELTKASIQIPNSGASRNGTYQCRAENDWGVSLSQVYTMEMASLGSFPPDKAITTFKGPEWKPLIIKRSQIDSVPKATYTWKKVADEDDESPFSVHRDRRVLQDLEGNLYFTHLLLEDGLRLEPKKMYKVEVFNSIKDISAGGSYSRVEVMAGKRVNQTPTLLYPGPNASVVVAIAEGQEMKLQCIFGGYPEVAVRWSGPPGVPYNTTDEAGTVLKVASVTTQHQAKYTCTGSNSAGQAKKTFDVVVETVPKFAEDGRPHDQVLPEGKQATFTCRTRRTTPPTSVRWYFDGMPVHEETPGDRVSVETLSDGKSLTVSDVRRNDTRVVRCEASNRVRTVHAEAVLNVFKRIKTSLTLDPSCLSPNTTDVTLTGYVTYDPSTKVTKTWTRDGKPIRSEQDPNLVLQDDTLSISGPVAEYIGLYGLRASDDHSLQDVDSQVRLLHCGASYMQAGPAAVAASSGSGLVIPVVVSVLLLVVIAMAVCVSMQRNKGRTYNVGAEERRRGINPLADLSNMDFVEIQRTRAPSPRETTPSCSSLPPADDPEDPGEPTTPGSLTEGQFDEDGSFIGQYEK